MKNKLWFFSRREIIKIGKEFILSNEPGIVQVEGYVVAI